MAFVFSLKSDHTLHNDNCLVSSDKRFYLCIQNDGNLVVYNGSPVSPLWASGTHGHGQIDCQTEASWPHDWIRFENEVLELVNNIRSKGVTCGGHWKSPMPPLKFNSKLTRSSRCHAVDMVKRNYFDHVAPDGQTMGHRIKNAGYSFRSVAENVARGQRSPHEVLNSWLQSTGHCLNIMKDFKEIGIGYVGDKHMWVQNFGTSF